LAIRAFDDFNVHFREQAGKEDLCKIYESLINVFIRISDPKSATRYFEESVSLRIILSQNIIENLSKINSEISKIIEKSGMYDYKSISEYEVTREKLPIYVKVNKSSNAFWRVKGKHTRNE